MSYGVAPMSAAILRPSESATYRNSASESMNFLISQGNAIRSILGRLREIHFYCTPFHLNGGDGLTLCLPCGNSALQVTGVGSHCLKCRGQTLTDFVPVGAIHNDGKVMCNFIFPIQPKRRVLPLGTGDLH